MEFKLGKSKITNFLCHKNFQGKKKTGKFGKTLANSRHISGIHTGKQNKIPHFFVTKISGEKKNIGKTLENFRQISRIYTFKK
jgi:hypothetical protein